MNRFYILHYGPTGCKIECFGRKTAELPKNEQQLLFRDVYNHRRKCSASKYANNIQKRVPKGVLVRVVSDAVLRVMCGF